MGSMHCMGQKGYARDSLQIKLYADIKYEEGRTMDIAIRKVFCDYCDEGQLKYLKHEGWRRAYLERNLPENRLSKGIRKLTLLIRISKEDFKNLKNE